jgi:hypothetical protein
MPTEQGAPSSPTIDEILDPSFNADAMDHGGFKDGDQHDDGLTPQNPEIDEGTNGKVIDDEPAPAPAAAEKTPTPAPAAADQAPAPKEPNEPFWYRKALKDQANNQKALEARLADQQRRLDELTQGGQQQERSGFDPVTDPDAFSADLDRRINAATFGVTLRFSERMARKEHGDALWEEANDWLATEDGKPIAVAAARHPDPCGYAVAEYQKAKLAAEIGDDPAKWREAERQKLKDELLAELRAEGQDAPGAPPENPARKPAPRIPGPASTQRSESQRGGAGAWKGPAPLASLTRNNFG